MSLITEENVCDKSPVECCGNTSAPGVFVTFCRECCGETAAVGLDVLVAGVVAEDDVGNRDLKWFLRVVLQRRPVRVEVMVFVGSKLMILADFVLIMKGVRLGNIVFHFCGVGRRLECIMKLKGKQP